MEMKTPLYPQIPQIKCLLGIFLFTILNSYASKESSHGSDLMIDQDGNQYKTIKIGTQVWMAENLKVTHFRNGDPIPYISEDQEWQALVSSGCSAYDNEKTNIDKHGLLYNWFAANDPRGFAPEGWRVPTLEDWNILLETLGGRRQAGGKLKSTSGDWQIPNNFATNDSGFDALPAGYRGLSGYFAELGNVALFASATEQRRLYTPMHYMFYENATVVRFTAYKQYGCSVRLIRE